MINCCDNCSHEMYNQDTNIYSCFEDKDKVFCAVETELQNWEYYELILKNYKHNNEKSDGLLNFVLRIFRITD